MGSLNFQATRKKHAATGKSELDGAAQTDEAGKTLQTPLKVKLRGK
jgi:hypothetical protein